MTKISSYISFLLIFSCNTSIGEENKLSIFQNLSYDFWNNSAEGIEAYYSVQNTSLLEKESTSFLQKKKHEVTALSKEILITDTRRLTIRTESSNLSKNIENDLELVRKINSITEYASIIYAWASLGYQLKDNSINYSYMDIYSELLKSGEAVKELLFERITRNLRALAPKEA